MPVTFRIERFEGPLDLLLQLVESQELNISTVSLAAVADQFVRYVEEAKTIPLEEMADFLVVAAKLIYMKSKLLLPSLIDQELEEGPDLETQLRRYRMFVQASKEIDEMWKSGLRSFPRERRAMKQREPKFTPPSSVTADSLAELMRRVISRLEPLRKLPEAAVERVINIQEKIGSLLKRIREHAQMTFHEFVGAKASKPEVVVSFLALLELVKQRFVRVTQGEMFEDISIEAHPDASAQDPLAHSFV
ncbi:MAG: ScpA family protein [Patescibacteria group bacterium]